MNVNCSPVRFIFRTFVLSGTLSLLPSFVFSRFLTPLLGLFFFRFIFLLLFVSPFLFPCARYPVLDTYFVHGIPLLCSPH